MQQSFNINHRKKIGLLTLITLFTHGVATQVPFLYHETHSILNNPRLKQASLFWNHFFSWDSVFHKPLTQLSYFIDYQLFGASAFYFHCNNIAIHLVNVILLYQLALKLRIEHAFIAAVVFALHPLSTASVSQVHGRSYALATLFMLLGFGYYLSSKKTIYFRIQQQMILIGLFCLMLLCKQTMVFFACVLLWHMWHTRSACSQNKTMLNGQAYQKTVLFSGLFILSSSMVILYALPNIADAVVSPSQYLYSQLGNMAHFIRVYFFPFQTALVHDLYFYLNINANVVLGGAIVFTLMYFAVSHKHTALGFFLGAFLISILPSNSIIPKNEVLREWRLYPSLVFFSLFFAACLDTLPKHSCLWHRLKRLHIRPIYLICIVYFGLCSASIIRQNLMYTNSVNTWFQVANMYPYSSDAINNIGVSYSQQKQYSLALEYFIKAISMDAENYTYELNMAAAYRELRNLPKSALHTQRALDKAKDFQYKQHSMHTKE